MGETLIDYIKSSNRSFISISNIDSDHSLFIKVRRYVLNYQEYQDLESEISILSNQLLGECHDRKFKELQLDALLKERMFFLRNVYLLLVDLYEKSKFGLGSIDQILYDLIVEDFGDLLEEVNNYVNEKSDTSIHEGLIKNAIQFSLKAHVNLLNKGTILHSRIEPSIFLLNQGQKSAFESGDLKFRIRYNYDFSFFLLSNSLLEQSNAKLKETVELIKEDSSLDREMLNNCYRQLIVTESRLYANVNKEYVDKAEESIEHMVGESVKSVHRGDLYNDVGLELKRNNSLEGAKQYYIRSIKLKKNLLIDKSINIDVQRVKDSLGNTYSNLSLVYNALGDYQNAISAIDKSINFLLDSSDNHFRLAAAFNNKAIIKQLTKPEEAVKLLYRVKEIRRENLDLMSNINIEKFANVSHNIGALLKVSGKLCESREEVEFALEYYEFLFYRSNVRYAYLYFNCLITLASVYKEDGKLGFAIEKLQLAEKVIKDSYVGVDLDKHLGRVYNNLANTYNRCFDAQNTIKYIDKSIASLGQFNRNKALLCKALKNGVSMAKRYDNNEKVVKYLHSISELNC